MPTILFRNNKQKVEELRVQWDRKDTWKNNVLQFLYSIRCFMQLLL